MNLLIQITLRVLILISISAGTFYSVEYMKSQKPVAEKQKKAAKVLSVEAMAPNAQDYQIELSVFGVVQAQTNSHPYPYESSSF